MVQRWRCGRRCWIWPPTIPPAGVLRLCSLLSAPDDHFTAGPDCRVIVSGSGRVGGAGGCPTVRAGIVSPAGVQRAGAAINSAPDDHFTAGPDCRVIVSASGRVGGAGGCPTIRAGIVSPAGVQIAAAVISAPDDHFTAGPDCRVMVSGSGRVGGAGGCPTIRAGIVSPAGVQIAACRHIRPRRSFHCRSRLPCDTYRAAGALVVLVAVQLSVLGLYLPPVFK